MDQSSCVLLEALKQLIDNQTGTAGVPGEGAVNPEEQEARLESMSQKSAARAKQLLTKLCKKKSKKATATTEREVATAPPVVKAPPAPAPPAAAKALAPTLAGAPAANLPPYAAMVLSAHEAKLEGDKLRIYLSTLKAITKGQDYFSRDVVYAVDALRAILDLHGSVSVIFQSGDAMELRDVLDARMSVSSANDQRIVEFTLGDMQVADGGELEGSLRDVQLIFGNLPMPPK
jgi:hypothetical protein